MGAVKICVIMAVLFVRISLVYSVHVHTLKWLSSFSNECAPFQVPLWLIAPNNWLSFDALHYCICVFISLYLWWKLQIIDAKSYCFAKMRKAINFWLIIECNSLYFTTIKPNTDKN